ncbi:MAG: DUF1329 domain-containing protein [Gammaproteobacteria bacterium]|nr:DUF1329 domain-containing protein [Gammaproteobacteria bacterium]
MKALASLLWSAFALLLCAPALAADFELDIDELNELSPRPGSVIDSASLARYAAFLDQDFSRFIASGAANLLVGEPLSFSPPAAFRDASARYRGQTHLTDQAGVLDGFIQGRPFSGALDVKDPDAGSKAAWNMRFAYTGDSGKLPEIIWQMRDWKAEKVQAEMLFEGRSMRFMHRHVLAPLPDIERNPEDAYGAFFMRAVEAGSYNGTEALVFANRDESRPLNGWVYIPQLGRTQTLAAFSNEESMFGSDILPTDFLVYSGPLPAMQWRYLGTTYMLLPLYRHDQIEPSPRKARRFDYWHTDFNGHAGCFPKVSWQLRPTLILEGRALDAAAAVTRRVFYLDAQTYVPALWKIYRGDNQLWKFVINAYAHPDSHLPDNRASGAPIPTASSTIDIAANRCTTLQLLTLINVPDVGPADFNASNMQHGGGANFRRR